MRWRLIFVVLVVAVASLGGYAFARSSSIPSASGWTAYAPIAGAGHTSTALGPRMLPSPPVAVVVPYVRGVDLDVAYARLHRAGFRVSFHRSFRAGWGGCLPRIDQQIPSVGERVPTDTVVTLRALPPRCGEPSPGVPVGRLPSAKVPDFGGGSISDAVAWAARHALYWTAQLPPLVAGDAPGLFGNYRVTRQQPRPGSTLALGVSTGDGGFRPTPLTLHGALEEHFLHLGILTGAIRFVGGPATQKPRPPRAGDVAVFTSAVVRLRRVSGGPIWFLAGREVAREHVRAGHDFRFRLAAGRYELELAGGSDCLPATAVVRAGHITDVDLATGCGIP